MNDQRIADIRRRFERGEAHAPEDLEWLLGEVERLQQDKEETANDTASDLKRLLIENRKLRVNPLEAEVFKLTWALDQLRAENARLIAASDKVGRWLSAAMDDAKVCAEMKADVSEWLAALSPFLSALDADKERGA